MFSIFICVWYVSIIHSFLGSNNIPSYEKQIYAPNYLKTSSPFFSLILWNVHRCPSFPITDLQIWENSSRKPNLCPKKKYQYVSSFFAQFWLPPAPGEDSKEASCSRFTSYNQTEWDPWCCVNRDEMAISSSLMPPRGSLPQPLPRPRIVGRPVWLSGTMEQRDLGEVAGTSLTEIAAVMNQAPETTSTSSLHKYPWARRSRVLPHRSPCWGLLLGSWKKRAGGGGGGGRTSSQHLSSGRGWRDRPARGWEREGLFRESP